MPETPAEAVTVVNREDLAETIRDAEICHHDRGSDAESNARMDRLRAALSGTAPQPSGAPQDAHTVDPGISGCPDLPDASAGLSAARTVAAWDHYAKHWRERAERAEATLARVREAHQVHSCERDGHIWTHTPNPCVNNGICSCGSTRCKTLAALDSPEPR